MKYKGKVVKVWEITQVGTKKFDKQDVILEELTDNEHKGWLMVTFFWDKVDVVGVSKIQKWDEVEISLNCRVNEYNWKYYNNITGWKIERLSPKTDGDISDWDDFPF